MSGMDSSGGGSWASAAAPIMQTAAGAILSKYEMDRAHGEAEWASRDTQAFVERMSSTAHQREMSDLKAAGLNPILAVAHGGASTPSAMTMPGKVPDFTSHAPRMVSDAMNVVSTLGQLRQVKAYIENLDSSTAYNDANTLKVLAETENVPGAGELQKSMKALNDQIAKLRGAEAGSVKGKSWFQSLGAILDEVRSFIPLTSSPNRSGGSGSSVTYSPSGGFR